MKNSLHIQNSITIHAPASVVWDALINPEQTKKYMFGCETVSDWNIGSELLWRGTHEGKSIVFVKGHIVQFEPNTLLEYSTFDPNSNIRDIPENYLNVTYKLKELNGETLLSVSQGDYALVADGDRRYNESYNNGLGWQPILESIKQLVESLKSH